MRIPPKLVAALPLLLAAAPAPSFVPGLWSETLTMTFDSANGSVAQAQTLQAKVPALQPEVTCRTATDLADPRALFLSGAERSCRFTRFAMADGRIDVAGDCSDGKGMTMHVAGGGRYDTGGYQLDFTGTGSVSGIELTYHGRDVARRIAACPVAQDAAAHL